MPTYNITNYLSRSSLATHHCLTNPYSFSSLYGEPSGALPIITMLQNLHFRHDPESPVRIVLDTPRGFALYVLETLDMTELRLVILTLNSCGEYWEDLWDLEPQILLAGVEYRQSLPEAIIRASKGESYRITPGYKSPLSSIERQMLRYLALGWPNKQVAEQLGVQEKTIRNRLTPIYQKINVTNSEEAILYYWGIWRSFGDTLGQR